MNKTQYNKGYQDAIESIKKAQQNNQNGQNGGQGGTPNPNQNNNQNGGQGDGQEGQDGQSRTVNNTGGKVGQVRPEDATIPDRLPVGGVMDKKDGDEINEKEKHKKSVGDAGQIWKQVGEKMRQAGNVPGSIRAKLTSIYKSNTDWKKELRRIVGKSISRDNYRRAFANKNALASQDRLARTDKTNYDALGSIVVAVDTSGSMSMEEFKIIIGELYALALQIKPMNLVVIQFDADVQSVDVYHGLADLKRLKKLELKGGGGTEVGPVFELLKNDKRFKGQFFELVMIMTDGWLTQYKRNPKTMNWLAWCFIDNGSAEVQYKEAHTMSMYFSTEKAK